ncbi:hypothetical protein [Herbaspirillum sp. alder98]|uniref:hypothetical protein n=1 Tax=Herbaspirillum sp. alder98 TaxID=2913096 RepID=UPI001CD823DD|nr:hypothetical protein [Herbaspirillum sp. alder98]MCA1323346.1 hypothetical protein [Herbaspirillum sp. alder98]
MQQDDSLFNPVLFIEDGPSKPMLDPLQQPYLLNHAERRAPLEQLEQITLVNGQGHTLVEMASDNPHLIAGQTYKNIKQWPRHIDTPSGPGYEITEFDFGVSEVRYPPLLATPDNAQAFGATLLRPGQYMRFPYSGLIMAQYTYGRWAGHESPYIGDSRRRELLPWNPTDLEFHDFAHVFLSRGPQPLVISVARWRPYVNEISLADLWVAPGDALVLSPKLMPPVPAPGTDHDQRWRLYVDMHNNRNSAQACRVPDGPESLESVTVLANQTVMMAPATCPRYHEEKHPTWHAVQS